MALHYYIDTYYDKEAGHSIICKLYLSLRGHKSDDIEIADEIGPICMLNVTVKTLQFVFSFRCWQIRELFLKVKKVLLLFQPEIAVTCRGKRMHWLVTFLTNFSSIALRRVFPLTVYALKEKVFKTCFCHYGQTEIHNLQTAIGYFAAKTSIGNVWFCGCAIL